MRAQPEPAPHAMAAEIAQLCASARRDAGGIYGQLLRENVADAIRCSFPRFSVAVGGRVDALADAFLRKHRARRPQFHHIATEFVAFAQAQPHFAPPLLALLEYEWAALAAEIDIATVPPPATVGEQAWIALNPTARLVVLPLDLRHADWSAALGDGSRRHAYAVYRTAAHGVVTRRLSYADCVLIEALRAGGAVDIAGLAARAVPDFPETEIRDWAGAALACGLVVPAQSIEQGVS